jgi:hypothetical protein
LRGSSDVQARNRLRCRANLFCSDEVCFGSNLARVPALLEKLPRWLVGVEACNTSHYWARELIALGQTSPNGTSDQKMSVLAVVFHGQHPESVFGPKAFRWPRSVERCGR